MYTCASGLKQHISARNGNYVIRRCVRVRVLCTLYMCIPTSAAAQQNYTIHNAGDHYWLFAYSSVEREVGVKLFTNVEKASDALNCSSTNRTCLCKMVFCL